MSTTLDKFILLIWKNWATMNKSQTKTIIFYLVPVLMAFLMLSVRQEIDYEYIENPTIYDPYQVFDQQESFQIFSEIAYSPSDNEIIKNIMNRIGVDYKLTHKMTPIEDSSKLENYYKNATIQERKVGVQFEDSLAGTSSFQYYKPKITIRFPSMLNAEEKYEWEIDKPYPFLQFPGPRNSTDPDYKEIGFLPIQQALSYSIMVEQGKTSLPKITMQRYPYAPYRNDSFYSVAEFMIANLVIFVGFMSVFSHTVTLMSVEKEEQLKESMKIMGLSNWIYYTSWFAYTFILALIPIGFIVDLLKKDATPSAVYEYSDMILLSIFFIFFAFSMIAFAFLTNAMCPKAKYASIMAPILWTINFLPFNLMSRTYIQLTLAQKIASSLLSNSAAGWITMLIARYESIECGLQLKNLFEPVVPDDNVSIGIFMIMLLIDCFIYLLLASYIEAIFPGKFGIPKPWYFPFTKEYWFDNKFKYHDNDLNQNVPLLNSEYFEKTSDNLPVGVRIQNLHKSFGNFEAVRNLNLDLYENQITVLLGHNGAGKTTTMSILTGMFPPTKGTAIINGYDIRYNIDKARESMSLCLQHNVNFDKLTVYEHLYFFGKLKGLKKDEVKKEIQKYLELLDIKDKKDTLVSKLSGGMKRKVAVGIAFCGRSKVVMLDEPTAGMDPSARRLIWDLLQQQKHGKTILLTTHFMDEAELLGDRIAIMVAGQLKCCGSSFFLKKKFGAGYYLIIDKAPNCKPDKITELLKKHITSIEIYSNTESELTYILPESATPVFEKMLGNLEQNAKSLGVSSYGVSLTTLEDVFFKVGELTNDEITLSLDEEFICINNNKVWLIRDTNVYRGLF